jgi:hypothetical protein
MFQKTPKILLSHILPITLMFILSQTIHSSPFSPTVNFTVLHHIHSALNTPSYPLPLHTHSTSSAKANTPPTQLLHSTGYTHSVDSPPVHPPGKHLRSTTSSISTPHDIDSTQDSTHPYIAILTTILNICWYAFVSSRGGRICKSTPGGGARSQFRELPFPLHRISTTSSLDPFDA